MTVKPPAPSARLRLWKLAACIAGTRSTPAAAITLRTARTGLPFSLTWWSFTFPLGTLVTGTSQLAVHTHAVCLSVAGVALYAGLVTAWLVVAPRTARGAYRGRLFLAPAVTAPARSG
jgi:tellurite resistance protein TehA-like permease